MGKNNRQPMGSVFNKTWVQIDVSKNTSRDRGKTDSCQFKRYFYFKSGSRKIIRKRSNRASTSCQIKSRFLQYVFPCTQIDRGFTANYKLKTSESVSPISAFQDGLYEKGNKFSQERRLGDFDRLPRCILPHFIAQEPQEISSVLHLGESLAIQSTPVRTLVQSKNVHEGGVSCSRLFENAKSEIGCLPGRLVLVECNKKQSIDRQRLNTQSLSSVRFFSKQGEISAGIVATNSVHWRYVPPEQRITSSNSRQGRKDKKGLC